MQTKAHLTWNHLLPIRRYITSAQSLSPQPQRYEVPHCCHTVTSIEVNLGRRWVGWGSKSMLPNEQIIVECKARYYNHLFLGPMAVRYPSWICHRPLRTPNVRSITLRSLEWVKLNFSCRNIVSTGTPLKSSRWYLVFLKPVHNQRPPDSSGLQCLNQLHN